MADPQVSQITQSQTTIPDYARPYVEDLLGQAQAQTDVNQNPYMQYMGDRVAQFSPMQQQSFDNAALMQSSPQLRDATAMAGQAGLGALNTGYSYNPYQANAALAPQVSNYQLTGPQNVTGPTLQNYSMGVGDKVTGPTLQNYSMGVGDKVTGPTLNNYQMTGPSQVYTQDFNSPGTAQNYMNPYMQNVVDIQKREAQRQAGIQGTQQQAQAVQAGAFGGSRDAIQRAERERNLSTQMNDIQAQGSNQAYQQAMNQFNTQNQLGLQAQQANQQAGLTVGQQNLASNLQTQGLQANLGQQAALANQQAGLTAGQQNLASNLQTQGLQANLGQQAALANQQAGLTAGQQNLASNLQTQGLQANLGQQAQLANQQMGYNTGVQNLNAMLGTQQFAAGQNLQAQLANQQAAQNAAQLNAQQGQFGAGLGLQGLQTALTGANNLANIGNTQYNQNMGINQLQNQYGTQQQGQAQTLLNNQYQDYLNAQNYPYKQMGFMSDMLRGLPLTQQSSTIYQPAPSMVSQAAGLGTAALGASKLLAAKGGSTGDIQQRGAGLADLAVFQIGQE
jgi:hypothetical protein